MEKALLTKKEGKSACSVCSSDGKVIASLKIKEWETNFFSRKFGILNIDYLFLTKLSIEEIHYTLDSLLSLADKTEFKLVEIQLNVSGIELVPLLEEKGFRLVDTRATFLTLIEKNSFKTLSLDVGKISFATKSDLKEILLLTHKCFTDNPAFFSRFKNTRYFSQEETTRYYTAWIDNHIGNKTSFFGVLKRDKKIIGYSIIKDVGYKDREKKYKAILSAIDPDYKGQNLYLLFQSSLCNYLPENRFYLDNTTQLTNMKVIQSHVKSKKRLNNIDLIFYRGKESELS